jgi:hypothetical protein
MLVPLFHQRYPQRIYLLVAEGKKNKLIQEEKLLVCITGVKVSNFNQHANCP